MEVEDCHEHQRVQAVTSSGEEGCSSGLPGSLITKIAGVLDCCGRASVLTGAVEVLETLGDGEAIFKYRIKVVCFTVRCLSL